VTLTGAEALSRSPHDEFLELVAISTSGELSREEQSRLQKHLAICPSCREVLKEFEAVVSRTIPAIAPGPEAEESDPSWSPEQAERSLFQRLELEDKQGPSQGKSEAGQHSKEPAREALAAHQAAWRNIWTLYAAGVLLFIALGVSAYQVGIRKGTRAANGAPANTESNPVLEQQLSDAAHERELLRAQMAQRDHLVVDLRRQLEQQSTAMNRMTLFQGQLYASLQDKQAGRQALLQERSDLSQELEAARAEVQGLRNNLTLFENQAAENKQSARALEAKVSDLTRLLRDREAEFDQQQELLAHDRDIRDLMGARDLYVAEVYDVERTGETKKPYGRVFYTKGKSLIFYAYDLDEQPGLKNASTFQAWGRRGPDRQQALDLGIFNVDNASKKRWVLRFDDPKALAEIDAVFVTVEPNGGSHKPSNKPLLFAYLHIDPNHP
jgi:hypothetical protein